MIKKWIAILMAMVTLFTAGCAALPKPAQPEKPAAEFFFPSEEMPHEGTWLTWPHKYAYKQTYYFGEDGIDGDVYAELLERV